MVFNKDKGWVGRWFSSYDGLESESEPEGGYHHLEGSRAPPIRDVTSNSRRLSRPVGEGDDGAKVESIYSRGYSTYQMGPAPGTEDYDLQMKKKEKKPSVNTVWARIRYWIRYAWKMFKAGLLAAGPGVAMGPVMAPPPMAAIISDVTRRRIAREGPVPDVYM